MHKAQRIIMRHRRLLNSWTLLTPTYMHALMIAYSIERGMPIEMSAGGMVYQDENRIKIAHQSMYLKS